MFLSDMTIKDYISQGKIIIEPDLNQKNIRPVGIRLHLGMKLLIPKKKMTVNLAHPIDKNLYDEFDVSKNIFTLRPNEFILASTNERIKVSRDLVCHLEGRSTIARLGLAIHCTSGIIDGNYEEARSIVFEIKNEGHFDIELEYKVALGMLTFSPLSSEILQAAQNQYKGQKETVAPNLAHQYQ